MAGTGDDENIRVTEGQLIALSNVHPGFWGAVKENYANAEGYASDGANPYCDSYLVNEQQPDLAYIYFRSHSIIEMHDASHVFDLGHKDNAKVRKHRKFNIGTYIVAGKMCRVGKTGMTIVSFDPVTKQGLVMRAYLADGYVCKVEPCLITLDRNGQPSLFATAKDAAERNRIEKLWLGTQWENGEFNQGASHKGYCAMLWATCVQHAMGDNKPSKQFATTVFLYSDLKTVALEGKAAPECFLKSTDSDILERDGGSPAFGFRNTIREHFLPYVNRMPLQGQDVKRRQFLVCGKGVTLNASGSEDAPWIAKLAKVINDAPKHGQEWYKLLGGHVVVKFCNVDIGANKAVANFKHFSRAIIGANNALPVGAGVAHGDKVISKTPFGIHKGECFQLMPEAAMLWEPLANALLNEGRVMPTHVDKLWTLMGFPEARREMQPDLTQPQRDAQLAENARALGVDQTGTKGYKWLCQLLIKPFRKARTKVDVEGVKRTTGVFKLTDFIDEKPVEINYLSKQMVREARAAGELDSDIDYANRLGYMAILGLTTAAIVQVGNCEQPMDKERLLDDSNAKKLHREFFRCLIHHVLSFPSAEVTAVRDAFLANWQKVEQDGVAEDKAVAWIHEELRRRIAANEKKKQDAAVALARKVAAAEEARKQAEAKAADELRKRKELEDRAAQGVRVSARSLNPAEEALKDKEVQRQLAMAQRAEQRAAAKEKRIADKAAEEARIEADKIKAKKEENAHKAELREQRTQQAAAHFSTSVTSLMQDWGFPPEQQVDPSTVTAGGDIYPRSKQTKDVARFNGCHEALEAACYAFDVDSLKPGGQPKVAPWVAKDPAIAVRILESMLSAECIPKALHLAFNYKAVRAMQARARKAALSTAASAVLTTPPAARQRGREDGPPPVGQAPAKRSRTTVGTGTNNSEAGGSSDVSPQVLDASFIEELDEHAPADTSLPVVDATPMDEDDVEDEGEEEEVPVDPPTDDEAQGAHGVAEI
jgi:hypothetical protein